MRVNWAPLEAELDLWRRHGLTLPIWWRDDDAVEVTVELQHLTQIAEEHALPVHLAVIPAHAQDTLSRHVARHASLLPVVHGWAHENHAPPAEKKAEFRDHRPLDVALADAENGMSKLQAMFGPALRPMFVPPWNRISPSVAKGLAAQGFRILSTATPRKSPEAAPGLEQVNTHLDPIDWRGGRSLIDPERLIAQLIAQLQDRREGRADNAEPYGLLTHHLVHDRAIWTFTEELIAHLMSGPVSVWTAPTDHTKKED